MCVENVGSNCVTENAANQDVGSEVLAAEKAAHRHRGCSAVGQQFHPRLGIFMRNDGGHGPGEHGMPGGERGIKTTMTPEPAVTRSFFRTLATGYELHGRIDQESIGQCFQFEFTSLLGVFVLLLETISPQPARRGSRRPQTDIRDVAEQIYVTRGQSPAGLSIRGY